MFPKIMYNRTEEDFRLWLRSVAAVVEAQIHLDLQDIPDIAYKDLYNTKVNPNQAARAAIKRAKE